MVEEAREQLVVEQLLCHAALVPLGILVALLDVVDCIKHIELSIWASGLEQAI